MSDEDTPADGTAEGPDGESAPTAGHHPDPAEDAEAAGKRQDEAEAADTSGGTEDAAPQDADGKADDADDGKADKADDAKADGSDAADGEAEAEAPAQETLHDHPLTDSLGQAVVHTMPDTYLELCQALREDGYDLMVGVTAVDYLVHPGRELPAGIEAGRFEVVVELASVATRRRLRVRCQADGDEPHVPSLFDVWPGSEAHERETYDMFGIVFDGHPDPSRILMPEDWEGHPLRKDYATGRIPVQFKETPGGR